MTSLQSWLPRSIECLRSYTGSQFTHDLIAGLTVGLWPFLWRWRSRLRRASLRKRPIHCQSWPDFLSQP